MANLLVVHNSFSAFHKDSELFHYLAEWDIHFLDNSTLSHIEIKSFIRDKEINFILISCEWDEKNLGLVEKLRTTYPLLTIIYYYSYLKNGEFAELHDAGINFCVIGEDREQNLVITLNDLWKHHWRRIPEALKPRINNHNSVWAKKVLDYLEKKPIKNLNTIDVSLHFETSDFNFRNEFKKVFSQSFRSYKQKLLEHYENVLLFEKKLKPINVYESLNYRNLSAFSRSFKARHGQSWQELVREPAI